MIHPAGGAHSGPHLAARPPHCAQGIGEASLARRLASGRPVVASMGPIASAALRALGVERIVEAREHTAQGLIDAVRGALEGTKG